MGNSFCLDTDILVNFLRDKPKAVDWFNKNKEKAILATTIINLFELYYGAYKSKNPKKSLNAIKDLSAQLLILNTSVKSVHEAGKQFALLEKKGEIIDIRDVLIGTIALVENFSFKTNNKKHFSRINELELI